MSWILIPIALLAGACIAFQSGANAQLKQTLGHGTVALSLNSVIGLAAILLYILASRVPWPALDKMADVPWWAWMGGLLGAAYGITVILLAKPLGAAMLMGLVVTGQLITSVALDHFGWIGFELHPVNPWRAAGCVLMLCGLFLISKF